MYGSFSGSNEMDVAKNSGAVSIQVQPWQQFPKQRKNDFTRNRMTPRSYDHATMPSPRAVSERPSHVIINNTGSYYFAYDTSASIGWTLGVGSDYTFGSVVKSVNVVPFRLDIQPIAWSASDAVTHDLYYNTGSGGEINAEQLLTFPDNTNSAHTPIAGDVTFVYKHKNIS